MWWSITCVLLCLVICQTAVTLPTGAVASEEVVAASAIIPETQVGEKMLLLSEADREKRALEAKTQAKFGLKTYLLDLIFGKINKAIDSKTGLIGQLDRLNIEKNKNLLKPPCDTSSGAAFAGYPASSGGLPPSSSSVSASAVQGQFNVFEAQGYPQLNSWGSPSLVEGFAVQPYNV
ncbi:unnamed protein product [Timema podura]|uniref:Uncharacterized protein n=1 Tax=Timema podura TaxID=61482 RepID=A0ABN7NXD3_TIMPD|nr:unnamed protein product [Timema podura]